MGFLSMCGLMTVADHEEAHSELKGRLAAAETERAAWKAVADDWKAKRTSLVTKQIGYEAKYKKAVTDLAAQSVKAADLAAEIARLRPLAEATERRRANDAKRVRPSRAKGPRIVKDPTPGPKVEVARVGTVKRVKPAAKAAGTKGKG